MYYIKSHWHTQSIARFVVLYEHEGLNPYYISYHVSIFEFTISDCLFKPDLTSLTGVTGFVLSPVDNGYVCQGDKIALTCTTSKSFLRWNISLLQTGYNNQRLVSAQETSEIVPLRINGMALRFTRVSSDPMVIELSIRNVTFDLFVTCTELDYLYANTLAMYIHTITNQGTAEFDY